VARRETLVDAVRKGSLAAVQRHLKKGDDVNKMSMAGTPIYAAATEGRLEIARVLIAAGADVDFGPSDSPLQRAIQRGHFDIALLLLGAKADPNRAPSPAVPPPLVLAVLADQVELVRALLDAGARRNVRATTHILIGETRVLHEYVTPLHIAAYQGNVAMAAELLERGADPGVRDGRDRTVIDVVRAHTNEALKALFA
jgi:ankyrin repeat protein